jgi:tRNA pseudouridine55 synthase
MQEDLSGVVVIDKPANITSARAISVLKRTLKIEKAGHTGTLDPFATGVLVCCMNKATKLARFFLHGEKIYRAVLHLGIETDTQDSTGTITAVVENMSISEDTIRSVIKKFEGASLQQPPIYSALKHEGTPLYKLARCGKPMRKPAREIFISSIRVLRIDLPFIWFEVCCSAGTYIRTLCADIGKTLGCGGHLKVLRRVKSSGFVIDEAIPLSGLNVFRESETSADSIIGMSDALRGMPLYVADPVLVEKITFGKRLTKKDFRSDLSQKTSGFIKIVDDKNKLCAVLDVNEMLGKYKYCCVFH